MTRLDEDAIRERMLRQARLDGHHGRLPHRQQPSVGQGVAERIAARQEKVARALRCGWSIRKIATELGEKYDTIYSDCEKIKARGDL